MNKRYLLIGLCALVLFSGGAVVAVQKMGATDFYSANGLSVVASIDATGNISGNGDLTMTGDISANNFSGSNTGDEVAASDTVAGIVELATQAEVDAGADATRAVTPASLATIQADVDANTAKTGNATHTGDVTGATVLTVDPTAISGKTLVTADAADHLLLFDATDSSLKKALVSDVIDSFNLVDDTTPQLGGPLDMNGQSITGNVLTDGTLTAGSDTDSEHVFGRLRTGPVVSDNLFIAHYDHYSATNYALRQSAVGQTRVNAPTGQSVKLTIANADGLTLDASKNVTVHSGDLDISSGDLIVGVTSITNGSDKVNLEALEQDGATSGQFLKWDGVDWVPATLTGGGDALVANPLSQFAATTSAQLAGVISDETGSGALVFGTSPTLTTPNLGTPSALVGTNISGTASSLTAGKATNIAGGGAGQLPYNSAADTTAYLAAGTAGQRLTSGGTGAPTWETPEPPASQTWVIDSPAVGGVYGPRIDTARTIDRIEAWTDTGTVDLNVEIRTAPNTSGTNSMTTDLQATSTSANQTTFNDDTVAAGEWLYLDISAVASSPTVLGVTVSYE